MKLGLGTFYVLPRNYPFRGPTLRANPAHSPTPTDSSSVVKHPILPSLDPDTHTITILWTSRPIVANGNKTIPCPSCAQRMQSPY